MNAPDLDRSEVRRSVPSIAEHRRASQLNDLAAFPRSNETIACAACILWNVLEHSLHAHTRPEHYFVAIARIAFATHVTEAIVFEAINLLEASAVLR
jgi:hypothetical protein